MCCFSNADALERVSGTRIFARFIAPARQVLAYSMTVATRADLAMILPLPVPPGSGEDAVTFINLEGYADLFDDLRSGFPAPRGRGRSAGSDLQALSVPLEVHDVGAFEASFVPTIADFSRLDPRFRIDERVWAKLPEYADYGFAVFKLKHTPQPRSLLSQLLGPGAPAEQTIHPMALSFPTRRPDALFFPTVHIHDGRVRARAFFDHVLYCQAEEGVTEILDWRSSASAAAEFVKLDRTAGLIDGARLCFKQPLHGMLPNQDTWLPRWAR